MHPKVVREEPVPYRGPKLSEIFTETSVAKLSVVLLILVIIGLILVMALSWVEHSITYKDSWGNEITQSASYDYNLEKTSGDPDFAQEFGGGGHITDYYKNQVWLSIVGFVLGIILTSLLLTFVLIGQANHLKNISPILTIIFGSGLLFTAALIAISGSVFINLSLMDAHSSATASALGAETKTLLYSRGGIIAFGLGLAILFTSILVIRGMAQNIPLKPPELHQAVAEKRNVTVEQLFRYQRIGGGERE